MGNDLHRSSNRHNGGRHALSRETEAQQHDVDSSSPAEPTTKSHKRMDKLRRSLTFRRKKSTKLQKSQQLHESSSNLNNNNNSQVAQNSISSNTNATLGNNNTATAHTIDPSKPTSWQDDERKVREGTCSFHVKYLGCTEVADSRGMHVCEQAIDKLLNIKKKPIKAILYVSGDSLRVVDESNKQLLLDQTIEKVSFCAPDRYHENGFAYICRDGTTRRWLCHGFMAIKDTIRNVSSNSSGGERLSHAVGCAFSVCLEKKQKRERENVSMEVGPNHSFTRFGSFRQASLVERLEDPQIVIPPINPIPIRKVDNPHAIERPKGNIDILNRQSTLRASTISMSSTSTNPFKRNTNAYSSLKMGSELAQSVQAQKLTTMFNKLTTTTTTSNAASTGTTQSAHFNTINEIPEELSASQHTQQVPPPLPPLPQRLTQNQQQISSPNQKSQQSMSQSFVSSTNTNPFPTNFNTTPFSNQQQQQHSTSAIFPTPQTTPNNYSYSYQHQQFYNLPQSTTTSSSSYLANESFEAKFARLQAAKKQTNPFADDLAKKYEIKL